MNNMTISFITLRRVIGIIGILMAFAVVGLGFFENNVIQAAISDYYYRNVRDFFVGIMVTVGIFLICYRGYEPIDTIVNTITGICAIGIGLFPDAFVKGTVGIFCLPSNLTAIFHGIFAFGFFGLLGFNSMFLFTKTDKIYSRMTLQKMTRNIVYFTCGFIIMFTELCMLFWMLFGTRLGYYPLICEAIMLIAFGVSWLVKGETILRDK